MSNQLTVLATDLSNKLNIRIDKECSIEDIILLEQYYDNYQFYVLNSNTREWEYIGPKKNKQIFILYIELEDLRHFQMIKSLPVAVGTRYFCNICMKGHSSYKDHSCKKACFMCDKLHCQDVIYGKLKCSKCSKYCNGENCLQNHIERCAKITMCEKCNSYKSKIHVCQNERWCINCCKAVSMDHYCCILTQKERDEKSKKNKDPHFNGFIFFDYECMVIEGEHVPNLVIADKICTTCLEEWKQLKNNEK
jgi:hypothetical protein